ncbi:IS110 family transposase, partial [Mesorhizobium sp. M8A.F.Ca.ET.167.01.1.1]|uniref:IS110 family transposase n=1 Tax=Mesorhizobium sp. M8A.F.Ca.ET.167.01.1.1 TaxID=2563961 RepID=UPI0010936783
MEATGVHDRLLRHALAKAGVAFSRHNPAHTHHYAKSTRRRAKTDPLDARMLSDYGRRYQPEAEPAPCEQNERLQSLAGHRDQLVDMRARLKKHLAEAFEAIVIASLEDMIADFDRRIHALESQIAEVIRQAQHTARDYSLMVSVPGVSKVSALSLLAHLPVLGQRSPKSIAALAGLAPFDNKSGKLSRRSQIQGGRSRVRRALYMAALTAIRTCDRFKAFYTDLAARSGSKKLAIIAVARKLLVVLNAIIRDKTAFA